ncbi:nucleoside-diphosphate sugar epimerase/dehydratase [Geobacillus sp. BK01]|uniref:nucleoside-diphosphate sugar epimerase/dehydratase n=1 Tax=Geobacillus sp. BK01 TaxID=3457328 RepID=UPI003FA58477
MNLIDILRRRDRKIIVFGTGSASRRIVPFIRSISYFIDNDSRKWGKSFMNKKVYDPKIILGEKLDEILIVVASMFYEEISQQLSKMGLEEDKHFIKGVILEEDLDEVLKRNSAIMARMYDKKVIESLKKFETKFVPNKPIFINSIPKSGTHLLRNIIAHFIDERYIHWNFVHYETLDEAQNELLQGEKKLFTGHLPKDFKTSTFASKCNMLTLIRDPYDLVLSTAKFLYSEIIPWNRIGHYIQANEISVQETISYVISGIQLGNDGIPRLSESYLKWGIQWFDDAVQVIRFEDLIYHIKNINNKESEIYFLNIFNSIGIDLPKDWKDRVLSGADRNISLTSAVVKNIDKSQFKLTENHKKMIEVIASNLRKTLGYA